MKKVFVLFMCLVAFWSCTKKEPEYRSVILKHILDNMDNPDHFVGVVKWEDPDSIFTEYSNRELKYQSDNFIKQRKRYLDLTENKYVHHENLKFYASEAEKYQIKSDSILLIMEKEKSKFIPKFIGYSVYVKYRIINEEGNMELTLNSFSFDPDFKMVANDYFFRLWNDYQTP